MGVEPRLSVLEKRGLATHTRFNVPQSQVYYPGFEGEELPGLHVVDGDVGPNGSNLSPVPEVYYDRLQLTNKGKIVFTVGFAGIILAGIQIASALKIIP